MLISKSVDVSGIMHIIHIIHIMLHPNMSNLQGTSSWIRVLLVLLLCSQKANMKHRSCTRCQLHLQLPSHSAIQIQVSPALRALREAGWSSLPSRNFWHMFCDYPYIRKCREIARWSSLLGLRCSSAKECQREMASSSSIFGARQEKWLHETICSLTWTLKSIETLDPMCLHSACPRITMQEYCNCSCIVWAWFCWATASFT